MLDKDYVGLDQRETIFLPIAHENDSLPQPCSDAILALLVTFAVVAETVLITQLPLFESHAIFPSIEQVNRSEGIPNVRQMWPEARQSTL